MVLYVYYGQNSVCILHNLLTYSSAPGNIYKTARHFWTSTNYWPTRLQFWWRSYITVACCSLLAVRSLIHLPWLWIRKHTSSVRGNGSVVRELISATVCWATRFYWCFRLSFPQMFAPWPINWTISHYCRLTSLRWGIFAFFFSQKHDFILTSDAAFMLEVLTTLCRKMLPLPARLAKVVWPFSSTRNGT